MVLGHVARTHRKIWFREHSFYRGWIHSFNNKVTHMTVISKFGSIYIFRISRWSRTHGGRLYEIPLCQCRDSAMRWLRNKQLSSVAPSEEQRERFGSLLQPLNNINVELAHYATLCDPLAQVSQSFWKTICVIKSTDNSMLVSVQVG